MTTGPSQTSVEAVKVDSYLVFLFLLLSTATLFEGFDSGMLGFASPETRADLDISLAEWGFVNGFIRLGVVLSFFFLLYADRWAAAR